MIKEMFSRQVTNYSIGISLGMMLSTVIIMAAAIFIVSRITRNVFKLSSGANKLKRALMGCAAGAGVMAIFIMIAMFGNHVVFSINIFLAILLLAGFFITHKLLNRI